MWFVKVKFSCNERHEMVMRFLKSLLAFNVEFCPIVPNWNFLIYICVTAVMFKVIATSWYVRTIHRFKLIHIYIYTSCSESKLWLLAIWGGVEIAPPFSYSQAQKVSQPWFVKVEKFCVTVAIKTPLNVKRHASYFFLCHSCLFG